MAERNPDKNYIGIDIKGARMWRGAKTATERGMNNVGFVRTRIEFILSFFAPGEIAEIWITFPDPQLKSRRAKKRLTSPLFLADYKKMLAEDGVINLKTDSKHLYAYTAAVIERLGLNVEVQNDDIYGSGYADEVLSVKTAYETKFVAMGLPSPTHASALRTVTISSSSSGRATRHWRRMPRRIEQRPFSYRYNH